MRPARSLTATALARSAGAVQNAVTALALCVCVCACGSTGAKAPAPVTANTVSMQQVSPDFVPAFEALQAALNEGDTQLARRILSRIWMRRPSGPTRELASGFDKIVSGRECASSLELSIECRAQPDGPKTGHLRTIPVRVVLCAKMRSTAAFALRPGPATLSVTRTAIDARGNEQSGVEVTSVGEIQLLELEPGATIERELAPLTLPLFDEALATRLRVELDLRSGTFVKNGVELPAQRLRVAAGETTARRPSLEAAGPAVADALAAIAEPGKFSATSALEIAVRVPPADRARALDALWPRIDTLPEVDVRRLVPSLRWLALTSEPGGGAQSWRAWMRARSAQRHSGAERERLALPKSSLEKPAESPLALERASHAKD